MCSDEPSVSAWVRNVRRPMPLGRKLLLIARNEWVRVVRLQACCGHPGEPGC